MGSTGSAETVTQGGAAGTVTETTTSVGGAGQQAGQQAGQLATTGGAPLAAETLLGALLALLGAALLKPREVLRRLIR
ncbi:MAG: hypothetical protein E6I01_01320 [Chloroflexi bacterium]|nr:MAG: hypothetical protein E6I01_01320 [Chloroflexota bacterium]